MGKKCDSQVEFSVKFSFIVFYGEYSNIRLSDEYLRQMGREEGGGFRMGNTCIPVAIHFDIWQNQYNIVKLNKIKLKKNTVKKKKKK